MNVISLKGINKLGQPQTFYLPHEDNFPVILGTGRNAVVLLGRTTPDDSHPGNDFLAFKFLKNDINQQYANMIGQRFFKEAEQTRRFGQEQEYFVRYWGIGAIGDLARWSTKLPVAEEYFNDTDVHAQILRRFNLQGPFYILDLCQGSLHDILERDAPWIVSSKSYGAIHSYSQTLKEQSELAHDDITTLKTKYFSPDQTDLSLSGYAILNAFSEEPTANKIRNYAVLELFKNIVWTVFQLHENELTHRDLKPGNLFVRHGIGKRGFRKIDFKLADLGYVADIRQLTRGDWSLQVDGWRNAGASNPGSIFYRAPEQIEPPFEVRVSIDAKEKHKVWIKGSKIIDIEKGDWLAIGDLFRDVDETDTDSQYVMPDMYESGVYKISLVEKPDQNSFLLTLEVNDGLQYDMEEDLQAHIIKLTGFHTDGFSLGSILYDLASGGKNPEAFFTYCLVRFHKGMGQIDYSVDNVMNVLAPDETGLTTKNGALPISKSKLTTSQKGKILLKVGKSDTIDVLVNSILSAFIDLDNNQLDEALDNYRFKKFPLVSDLLTDKRGQPIPADILEIIVKCMLRDIEGSYYDSHETEGFFAPKNIAAVKSIHRDVQELLGKSVNKLPNIFPAYFQENLLIKLKMFWGEPYHARLLD